MSGFYNQIERIHKSRTKEQLTLLIHYFGIELDIYEEREDVNTSVFGKFAQNNSEFAFQIKGILTDEGYFPSDGVLSGGFQEGYLYTLDTESLRVGHIILFNSSETDGKIRRYKISSEESFGLTTDIFPRYKIVALND